MVKTISWKKERKSFKIISEQEEKTWNVQF
jgi:hypothetical protein